MMNSDLFILAQKITAQIKDVDQKLFDLENMKTALKSKLESDRIEATFTIFLTGSKTTYHFNTYKNAHDKDAITDLVDDEIDFYQDRKKYLEIEFANL